ncbi:hypothetical protein BDP27DRAFT_1309949 [Rhodocollybia butyracea]|uniref:Uncharacterized protein n=1 Tax=Rhodocollybia butyracea TaxID=206335 RepID=A0A9P5Q5T6_9AGAR|nr:hypothetical protein BDP27DRAFT_1309949 [Rhodocollybia butyracea]
MDSASGKIHRRKSSKSDDENTLIVNATLISDEPSSPLSLSPLPTRPAPPPPRSPLSSSHVSRPQPNTRAPILPTPPPEQNQNQRSRVNSTPGHMGHTRSMSISVPSHAFSSGGLISPGIVPGPPPSAGAHRTSFKVNSHPPTSPFRNSISSPQNLGVNGHSRTRSISTPYTPPLPSPLSFSFPIEPQSGHVPSRPNRLSASKSAPETNKLSSDTEGQTQAEQREKHTRRHSRLHSRNLSIFFPRPGSLPANSISEDGSQELEFPSYQDVEAMPIPSAGSSVSFPSGRRTTSLQNGSSTSLGAGFTFGGRQSSISGPTPPLMSNGPLSANSTSSRRGHHHKHSLSHNFFSFLEPGAGGPPSAGVEQELYTQPTPTPVSPWNPISPFPQSAGLGSAGVISPAPSRSSFSSHGLGQSHSASPARFPPTPSPNNVLHPLPSTPDFSNNLLPLALPFTILQFIIGAFLWISGQQIGSLGTTGLGYWVVFDSFGVGIGGVLGRWLKEGAGRDSIRRPYGNARIETVLQFAQSVYLMFSSVYVCKETVEHILLSAGPAGAGDGHHHHAGDEDPNALPGIQFPYLLAALAFFTLVFSATVFDNHRKLVDITGNQIPPLPTIIRSISSLFSQRRTHAMTNDTPPSSKLGLIASNPYVIFPLCMCVAIWWGAIGLDTTQHSTFDLALAAIITLVTFRVSYSASVVLGTVLLQTAPRRVQKGVRAGRMEAFLRVMKEVERHPQVLHLPAPHIWQFTPTPATVPSSSFQSYDALQQKTSMPEQLVVTLELHVRQDLADEDVLKLTKWAWERCVGALTVGVNGITGDVGEGVAKAEVSVGVVKG